MATLIKNSLFTASILVMFIVSTHALWAGDGANSTRKKNMITNENNSVEVKLNEALSGVEFTGDKFKFGVLSFGCTNAADFQVEYAVEASRCNVTIVRTKPDHCRRAPFVAPIEIEWAIPKDCIDLAVHMQNPVLVAQPKSGVVKRMK